VIGECGQRVNRPKVFFQVGAAWSFSEHDVTIVASMSTVTRPPSAPCAASPVSAQARCRAAARAARITFKARGAPGAATSVDRRLQGGFFALRVNRWPCLGVTHLSRNCPKYDRGGTEFRLGGAR